MDEEFSNILLDITLPTFYLSNNNERLGIHLSSTGGCIYLHDCDKDSAENRFARWVGVECSVGTAVAAAALCGTVAWATVAVVADVNNGGAKELCEEGLVMGCTAAVGVDGTALKIEDEIKMVISFAKIPTSNYLKETKQYV